MYYLQTRQTSYVVISGILLQVNCDEIHKSFVVRSGTLLVFGRKDLCDARPKPEMSSYFQMKSTCGSHVPPVVTSGGQGQKYIIFSDDLYRAERIRSSIQIKCTLR